MKISLKKVLFMLILAVALVILSAPTLFVSHTDSIYPKAINNSYQDYGVGGRIMDIAQTQTVSAAPINKKGNANYYNDKNGEYYADVKYKVKANDNTSYLVSLLNSGETVNLPAGNYLCRTNLVLKNRRSTITGVPGKTRIVFDSKNYVLNDTITFREGFIINDSYYSEYKDNTAQEISISGVTFEYKRFTSNSPKTILLFKNIKKADINNCSFIADLPNKIDVTNIDLYNGCKNVTISDCFFSNRTKASSGGCIWVRNLTASKVRVNGNLTENIIINKCSFDKDSKDEVIAVYSSVGDVKDVTISNCSINDYSDDQEIVLSAYSSEDKYYGIVENVTIHNNDIYSKNFNAFVIMIGVENRTKPASNITIANNKIVTDSTNSKRKITIYNSTNNKNGNVVLNNNVINAASGSYYVAIANATASVGNTVTGNFENGIVGGTVINNTIIGAINGIVTPDFALNNKVSQGKFGVRVYSNSDSMITKNVIELDKSIGVCGIDIPSQGYVTVLNNTIYTLTANQTGITAKSPNTVLSGNNTISIG